MHHVLKGMVAERTLFWDFPEQIKVENMWGEWSVISPWLCSECNLRGFNSHVCNIGLLKAAECWRTGKQ